MENFAPTAPNDRMQIIRIIQKELIRLFKVVEFDDNDLENFTKVSKSHFQKYFRTYLQDRNLPENGLDEFEKYMAPLTGSQDEDFEEAPNHKNNVLLFKGAIQFFNNEYPIRKLIQELHQLYPTDNYMVADEKKRTTGSRCLKQF